MAEWGEFGGETGLLLLDSACGGFPDLVVVDADDPSLFDWVVETFGKTNLTVESGRDGGGRHHYYRAPYGASVPSRNTIIGPVGHHRWVEDERGIGRWKSKCDLKASRAYVVCPGSKHNSGLIYQGSAPITPDTILSLPLFDVGVYDQLVSEYKALPRPADPRSLPGPCGAHGATGRSNGIYERRAGDPAVLIPGPGPLAGRAVFEAAAAMAEGDEVTIGCPEHASRSGRSATMRFFLGGCSISCHVEHVTYVYGSAEDEAESYVDKVVRLFEAGLATGGEPALNESSPSNAEASEVYVLDELDDRIEEIEKTNRWDLAAVDLSDIDRELASTAEFYRTSVSLPNIESISQGHGSSQKAEEEPLQKQVSSSHAQESEVFVAERYLSLGKTVSWCQRGRVARSASSKDPAVGVSYRLACLNLACPSCGPRLMRALRAAAWVRLQGLQDWAGARGALPPNSKERRNLADALARWARVNPDERHFLIVAQNELNHHSLLFWRGKANEPARKQGGGSLASFLSGHGKATIDLPESIDEMLKDVDPQGWGDVTSKDKRVKILRGTLSTEILALRDLALGRTDPPPDDEERRKRRPVFRGYMGEAEFRQKAGEVDPSDIEDVEVDGSVRSQTLVRTWKFRATNPIPVEPLIRKMIELHPPKRKNSEPIDAPPTAADGDGFVDLTL